MALGFGEMPKLELDQCRQHEPKQLRSSMADNGCHLGRFQSILERRCMFQEMKPGPSDHMTVGDFNATVSVLPADPDAGAELLAGRTHMATQVIGIAKTAQRQSFSLGRTNFTGKTQCLLVFRKTALYVAKWKINIASKVVDMDKIRHETVADCCCFRMVECLQCRLLPVSDAHPRRHANPCLASLHVICGRLECHLESNDRFPGGANVPQRIAAQAHHLAFCGRIVGQFNAAISQPERGFEVKRSGLCLGGIEIGRRGSWIIGAIEMLRA